MSQRLGVGLIKPADKRWSSSPPDTISLCHVGVSVAELRASLPASPRTQRSLTNTLTAPLESWGTWRTGGGGGQGDLEDGGGTGGTWRTGGPGDWGTWRMGGQGDLVTGGPGGWGGGGLGTGGTWGTVGTTNVLWWECRVKWQVGCSNRRHKHDIQLNSTFLLFFLTPPPRLRKNSEAYNCISWAKNVEKACLIGESNRPPFNIGQSRHPPPSPRSQPRSSLGISFKVANDWMTELTTIKCPWTLDTHAWADQRWSRDHLSLKLRSHGNGRSRTGWGVSGFWCCIICLLLGTAGGGRFCLHEIILSGRDKAWPQFSGCRLHAPPLLSPPPSSPLPSPLLPPHLSPRLTSPLPLSTSPLSFSKTYHTPSQSALWGDPPSPSNILIAYHWPQGVGPESCRELCVRPGSQHRPATIPYPPPRSLWYTLPPLCQSLQLYSCNHGNLMSSIQGGSAENWSRP